MEKGDKKQTLFKIQNLIIYYFACSILGWIMEIIYAYMIFHTFVDRGFLYGPMCPIYGYGAVMMVLITDAIKKKNVNTIETFFIITIIFTLLEYLVSLALELIFNLRWWDYTNEFLNLNGRVCLLFSLFFGIIGIIFIKKIYEPSNRLIKKIREKVPTQIIWLILIVLIGINTVDTVFSTIKYIKPSITLIEEQKILNTFNTNKNSNIDLTLDGKDFYDDILTSKYKDIRKLDEDYSIDNAIKDNCFVINNAKVYNEDLYENFINSYNDNTSAFIRVIQPTVEGNIIIYDIKYVAEISKVVIVSDLSRDKFSEKKDRNIKIKQFEKIGIYKKNNLYLVAYNGELKDDTFNSENVFEIAIIN